MTKNILEILTTFFFDSSHPPIVLANLFVLAGLWKIFEKCGEKGFKSLIPGYRYYILSKCADREPEGRVLLITDLLYLAVSSATVFLPEESTLMRFVLIGLVALSLILMIYYARVYSGLCENFGRGKLWVPLWIVGDFFCAPLFGFSKEFRPQWKVQEMEEDVENFFSGGSVAVLDKGLTVNLRSRTVTEMFKKKYLLRDIHLYIKPGSMVLLLGGSGAGKTTLVNAMNGYEKADADIMLNGRNMYKEYDQMMYDVGYVPQQDLMRGNDTVLRTLMDASSLRLPVDFNYFDRRKRVDDVMEIFGLTPVKDSLLDKLSGGQRKRVSIAMEFISNPTLFILDEPDSGLDGVMARELMSKLREIADQGKIVIVITHTPDRVADMFDSVIVLAKDKSRTGRLAFYGSIPEARTFFERDQMEEILKRINRTEEGGEGLADEFIRKFAEAENG